MRSLQAPSADSALFLHAGLRPRHAEDGNYVSCRTWQGLHDCFEQYPLIEERCFRAFSGGAGDAGDRLGRNPLGFQVSSLQNQLENVMMLLVNKVTRMPAADGAPDDNDRVERAVRDLHDRDTFDSYVKWCKNMGVPADERYPPTDDPLNNIALWWSIWGEAANLRFMPECLCFLFYLCARQLRLYPGQQRPELGNLQGAALDQKLQRLRQTGADGKPEWFLHNVVAPLYAVLSSEGKKMRFGKLVDHRERKHYDDINEFFWSHAGC